MTRCQSCGQRVRSPSYECAVHGPVPQREPLPPCPLPTIVGFADFVPLGRGGFGCVYAATRQTDGVRVAIKIARTEVAHSAERLHREAEALAAIGAPYVPQFHGSGTLADGAPYLVMELVELPTLAERLALRGGPLPLEEFAALAPAILLPLAIAHGQGFVHRDLKPDNVFVGDAPPVARLVDFGLTLSPGAAHDLTGSGSVVGSTEYMAPEQCAGGAIDERTDVYAMGVVLFEMLAGRPPFFGSPTSVRRAHVAHRPPRIADLTPVPRPVEDVVLRCLAKDPRERFQGAGELARTLREALRRREQARATPVPATSPREIERLQVGLVFFTSSHDAGTVRAAIDEFGGQLAHTAGAECVALFDHDAGENPARRAVLAARALVEARICACALVDLAPVRAQRRADGQRRWLSPLFTQRDRFPVASVGTVSVTPGAATLLPDLPLAPADRPGGFLRLLAGETPATALRRASTPLVGRDDVLAELEWRVREAQRAKKPLLATVIGDPGHGKSHLCAKLAERIREAGWEVVEHRAREAVGGDGQHTLRALVRTTLDLGEEIPTDLGKTVLAERLGASLAEEVWAGVAILLNWISPSSPRVSAFVAAPGALRSAVSRALGEALRRRAAPRPLCLILDDAQFADETTLDALEYATLAEGSAQLAVCVLARSGFEQARPSWGDRAGLHHRTSLGPLAPEAAAELCRLLLQPAETIPQHAIDLLVSRTRGIPLLLVELVRGLKREGLLRRHGKGTALYVATEVLDRLPDLPLVHWLAQRELEGLPAELATHARLVALLGSEVTLAEIAGVLDRLDEAGGAQGLPLDAGVGTRRLLALGMLIERRGDRFGFRHALLREAVCATLSAAQRLRIHEAAYRFYRDATLADAERLPKLAHHAALSGASEVAASTYLALAEQAQLRHAYLEGESYYGRAIELLRDDTPLPQRIAAFRGRGLMRFRLARHDDALADFAKAGEAAERAHDQRARIEILLDEATALDWIYEWRRSLELTRAAQQLATQESSPLIEARLTMALGRSCQRFNQDEEAADLLLRAADLAEPLGADGYETLVISLFFGGYVLATLARLGEAQMAFERAIALCERSGDLLHLAGALQNRTLLWMYRDDRKRLLADVERCITIARALGNDWQELQAENDLARFLHWLGRTEEAEQHACRAIAINDRRYGDGARLESPLLLARIHTAAGDKAAARTLLADIRQRLERAHRRGDVEVELVPIEEVQFAMVDLATRESTGEEWDALEERAQRTLPGPELIELLELRGRCAMMRQQREEAARAFEAALAAARRTPNMMSARIERELATARAMMPSVGMAAS